MHRLDNCLVFIGRQYQSSTRLLCGRLLSVDEHVHNGSLDLCAHLIRIGGLLSGMEGEFYLAIFRKYFLLRLKNKFETLFIIKSVYRWSSSNGYTITGSCATSCTAETVLLTGTVATRGTVCSSSIYGNPASYSSSQRVNFSLSLFVMVSAFLLLGLNLLF